jgi:hypothetical protein
MKKILALAAALEGATGLALMVDPAIVARLLFGDGVSGIALAIGRVAGFGLLSLGLACWPGSESATGSSLLRGLLCYNLLVTIYLLVLGIGGEWVGVLLWPVVALHAVLTSLLAGVWLTVSRRADAATLAQETAARAGELAVSAARSPPRTSGRG